MQPIVISLFIKSDIQHVWEYFTEAKHVVNWNFANADWHCPKAEGILGVGKIFTYTMSSMDGAMSFDYSGTYVHIDHFKNIQYVIASWLNDSGELEYDMKSWRKVEVLFEEVQNGVMVTEIFEPEDANTRELQSAGWLAILENFKKYVESN